MSGRGKRIWAPRLDFDGAFQETIKFIKRSREHNIVRESAPVLLRGWYLEHEWNVGGMQPVSQWLQYGFGADPQDDRIRSALVRLLSASVKAHFFIDEKACVRHEPYLFLLPDLAQPGQHRHGVVYPLEGTGKSGTFVVAEWDVFMSASRKPRAHPFPVVLQKNSFHWLARSRWRELREAMQAGGTLAAPFDFQKPEFLAKARSHADAATFPYGTLLDFPRDMNPEVVACGGQWAPGIRKWFLPTGFDSESVIEYLNYVRGLGDEERYMLRWWSMDRRPVRKAADATGNSAG